MEKKIDKFWVYIMLLTGVGMVAFYFANSLEMTAIEKQMYSFMMSSFLITTVCISRM